MKPVLFPFATGLRLLPDLVHTEVMTRVVNHMLKGQTLKEDLDYLEGKRLCLAVSDTNNAFCFRIVNQSLRRCPPGEEWDVRIQGRLEDFWKLATRAEDPDTLFFHRQLSIEGDTDAGLYLKNLLDALDFDLDAHLEAVLGPRFAPMARGLAQRTGIEHRLKRLTGAL